MKAIFFSQIIIPSPSAIVIASSLCVLQSEGIAYRKERDIATITKKIGAARLIEAEEE